MLCALGARVADSSNDSMGIFGVVFMSISLFFFGAQLGKSNTREININVQCFMVPR